METNRVLSADLRRAKTTSVVPSLRTSSLSASKIEDKGNDDAALWRQRRGTGFAFSGGAGNDRLLVEKTQHAFNTELYSRSCTDANDHEATEAREHSDSHASHPGAAAQEFAQAWAGDEHD